MTKIELFDYLTTFDKIENLEEIIKTHNDVIYEICQDLLESEKTLEYHRSGKVENREYWINIRMSSLANPPEKEKSVIYLSMRYQDDIAETGGSLDLLIRKGMDVFVTGRTRHEGNMIYLG